MIFGYPAKSDTQNLIIVMSHNYDYKCDIFLTFLQVVLPNTSSRIYNRD